MTETHYVIFLRGIVILLIPALTAWGFGWAINARFPAATKSFPSFIVGFLVLNLLAQLLFVSGLPIKFTPFFLGTLVLTLVLIRPRLRAASLTVSFGNLQYVIAPFILVAIFSIPYLFSPDLAFHGYYWGDAVHYDLLSNYIYHLPDAKAAADVLHPQYNAVRDSALLDMRLGQSFTQALCSSLTLQPTINTFYCTSFLSVLLFYFSSFFFLKRYVPTPLACWSSAIFCLTPAYLSLNYDCFQSQGLAVPIYLFLVLSLTTATGTHGGYGLIVPALATNYIWATYPELAPLIALPIVILFAFRLFRITDTLFLLRAIASVALGTSLFFVCLGGRFSAIANLSRAAIGGLNAIFVHAYEPSGISSLYFGELTSFVAERHSLLLFLASAICIGVGMWGLFRLVLTRKEAGASCLLALTLIPWAIPLLLEGRTYQFYKLLLSFSPLCVLGLLLLACEIDQKKCAHSSSSD